MEKLIIIIDSGIGGATVLQEVLKSKNFSRLIYLADQKYFPYGSKSPTWIKKRVKKLISWSITQDPCCIILACNTATSQFIVEARDQTGIPIIGVEPVIKPLSQYKNSLLLGTTSTLNSPRTKELKAHHKPTGMISYAPIKLAEAIEEMNENDIERELYKILENTNQVFQAIGLSCTHYPLTKEQLQKTFPQSDIIDPSEAVVRQINRVCHCQKKSSLSTIDLYTTGEVIKLKKQFKKYLDLDLNPRKIEI